MMTSETSENHRQMEQCSQPMDSEEDVSDAMSDDDCYGDSELYRDMEDCFQDTKQLNSLMRDDIACYEKMYGPESITTRHLESIEEIDIDLQIPITFLQDSIGSAWCLNCHEPITVRLHMSSVAYLDSCRPPVVELYQVSKKEKVCVLQQLKKILEKFAGDLWSRHGMSNDCVAKHKAKAASERQQQKQQAGSSGMLATVNDMALSQMVEMGIDHSVAEHCLVESKGNMSVAVNMALGMDIPDPEAQSPQPKAVQQPKSSNATSGHRVSSRKAVDGHRGSKKWKPVIPWKAEDGREEKELLPESHKALAEDDQAILEIQEPPSLQHGFLVQVALYVQKRLLTLNEFCVVCDRPHIFTRRAILKPAVCARELCVFAFQTLGVMVDAANDIAVGHEVIALLVALTKFAAMSERREKILDPYPVVVDPTNAHEMAITPTRKDYDFVIKVLNHLKMDEMLEWQGVELKKKLDEKHRVAYPLLQWIIASNRSHIELLPHGHQLAFMGTPYQFLLMSNPPAKEAKFLTAKARYGSVFAFHGSGIENWHGIIRDGLVIASGTSKQVNGSAYGRGIYLSPLTSVSFNYCVNRHNYGGLYGIPSSKRKLKSEPGKGCTLDAYKQMLCIALCEVINCPETLKRNEEIWVCSNSDHVCTRFFFVFVDGMEPTSMNVDISSNVFQSEVIRALNFKL